MTRPDSETPHPTPRRRAAVRRGSRATSSWLPIGVSAVLLFGAAWLALGASSGIQRKPVAGLPMSLASTSTIQPETSPTAGIAAKASTAALPSALPQPSKAGLVIAWQPSHQADTGPNWEEYVICGDIMERVIARLPEYEHVRAWDTSDGLTGSNNYRPSPSNTKAFDKEVAIANAANATVFIAIHTDGGAPSGILGECLPGDSDGRGLLNSIIGSLVSATGLHRRSNQEVRLYSLESSRNKAKYKCLLEVGDNVSDRAFLLDPKNRDKIADGIAAGVRAFDPKP